MATDRVHIQITGDDSDYTRAVRRAQRASKDLTDSWESVKSSGRAVGGRFSEMGERLDNLKRALGTASGAATFAALSIGVTAAAALRAGKAIVDLVRHYADLADEMEAAGKLTHEQADELRQAKHAMDSFADAMDKAGSRVAVAFADEVTGAAYALEQLTLAMAAAAPSDEGLDAWTLFIAAVEGFSPGLKLTRELLADLDDAQRQEFETAMKAAEVKAQQERDTKRLTDALKDLSTWERAHVEDLDARAVAVEAAYGREIRALQDAQDGLNTYSDAYEATQVEITLLEKKRDAELAEIDAEREKRREREIEQIRRTIAASNELAAAFRASHLEEMAQIGERNDAREDAFQQWQQQAAEAANSMMASQHAATTDAINRFHMVEDVGTATWDTIATSVTSAMQTLVAAVADATEENADAQRVLGHISVAISTAAAIMQAFAQYGPTPWGYASAAAMGAAGIASHIAIEAAQGGMDGAALVPATPSSSGSSGGFGGADFEPVNSGGSTARTSSSAVVAFGGRMYDVATGDALRRDSALARALAGADGSARGQRRRR